MGYVTGKWRSWEELTGVKKLSRVALTCQLATLADKGILDIATFYLEATYRYWYLMVSAINKETDNIKSALNVSEEVAKRAITLAGYKEVEDIDGRAGCYLLASPSHNYSVMRRFEFGRKSSDDWIIHIQYSIGYDICMTTWDSKKFFDNYGKYIQPGDTLYLQTEQFIYPQQSLEKVLKIFGEEIDVTD